MGPVPNIDKDMALDIIQRHNVDFDWWSVKADIDVESPEISGKGDAIIRIKKDSLIWLVGKKLGIEGVRASIYPDQVEVIFRQTQSYAISSFYELQAKLGANVNFYDLQHIIVGNVIVPDTLLSMTQEGFLFTTTAAVDDLVITYVIHAYDGRLASYAIEDKQRRKVRQEFVSYEKLEDGGFYPQKIITTFESNSETYMLSRELKELEINVEKKTPFDIPSYYDRISW